PRGCVILVFEKVMHSQPKILQAEFPKILATDCERIKVVFLQISPKFAAALLVFSPNESSGEKQQGDNDRRNYVYAELVLQNLDHMCSLNSVAHFSRTRSFAGQKFLPSITDIKSSWRVLYSLSRRL